MQDGKGAKDGKDTEMPDKDEKTKKK